YGLTGVNHFAKDEAPAGIFGAGRKASGLGEAVIIRQKQSLAGLETFLFDKIEKRYRSPLAKALKIFGKISFEHLRDWLDWLEPIFLYRAGLAFKRGVYGLGLRDCAARPEGESFSAADMRHPNSVLAGNAPVPVSLKFNAGDAVFVTGANGSGKTTGLKALAQNAVVAQLGFNVPAEKFCFAPQKSFATLFSSGEDGMFTHSRFQREAELTKKIVAEACDGAFVLLNEPFSSTNPDEAKGLLCEVLKELHEKRATVVVVTHLYEAYAMLEAAGLRFVKSYVTKSEPREAGVAHFYTLEGKKPGGYSHAKLLAIEHGLLAASLVKNKAAVGPLEKYLSAEARDA
ncbi:MAG: hypothetical protein FWF03_07900, partial [Defluviitaleaceae bacterium]|nr:hypothetical protein [Defluviitaleaceae bacterium]